ncbi:MAG: DUF4145 domain-containing protein, partial [Atribacterota bacterium]|nr:DUF4145 domain-containing protein [Atribacterota bacterium]
MIGVFNYKCPYCGNNATITDPDFFGKWIKFEINETDLAKNIGFNIYATRCPNEECNKITLIGSLHNAINSLEGWRIGEEIRRWTLLPESEAKPLPNYIPKPIQQDYFEACRIKDLSSKASATLSRRCLQGMIRDFWGIKKNTLKLEIDELEDRVDSDT